VAHPVRRRSRGGGTRHHRNRFTSTNNGIILTESGLIFGAGRDNQIRAWDSDSGKEVWSSKFGGSFVGSPVMFVTGGKQYLLVRGARAAQGSAASVQGRRLRQPGQRAGWLAYAVPDKQRHGSHE
jgi:outer membrane protein assembly factor BamB